MKGPEMDKQVHDETTKIKGTALFAMYLYGNMDPVIKFNLQIINNGLYRIRVYDS